MDARPAAPSRAARGRKVPRRARASRRGVRRVERREFNLNAALASFDPPVPRIDERVTLLGAHAPLSLVDTCRDELSPARGERARARLSPGGEPAAHACVGPGAPTVTPAGTRTRPAASTASSTGTPTPCSTRRPACAWTTWQHAAHSSTHRAARRHLPHHEVLRLLRLRVPRGLTDERGSHAQDRDGRHAPERGSAQHAPQGVRRDTARHGRDGRRRPTRTRTAPSTCWAWTRDPPRPTPSS